MDAIKEWWPVSEMHKIGRHIKGFRSAGNLRKKLAQEGCEFREVKSPGCKGATREFHINSLPPALHRAILLKHNQSALHTAPEPIKNTAPTPTPIPPEPQPDYALKSEFLQNRFMRAPESMREQAEEKFEAIGAFRDLISKGVPRGIAKGQVAELFSITRGTLSNYLRKTKGLQPQDHCAALLPNYIGRAPSIEISPDAWNFWFADYMRPAAPTASACFERLKRVATKEGWVVPKYVKQLLRKLRREHSAYAIILARQGEKALECTYPAEERDRTGLRAMQAVTADGHRLDVLVQFPDGTIGRVVIVVFEDEYSGMILSWRMGKTESADLIRLAFADLVEKYGIPEEIRFDRGLAFNSKWFVGGNPKLGRGHATPNDPLGIFQVLGIKFGNCMPYHGQSKRIERSFGLGNLSEYIPKHPACAGAGTGRNPIAKPSDYGDRAVPYSILEQVVMDEVIAHNIREGRRSAVCRGRSFAAVFNESYSAAAIRKVTEAQRYLLLLPAEKVKVSPRDGCVSIGGNRYHHMALAEYMSRSVVVRYDPEHLHEPVYVSTLAGELIAKADCLHKVGFSDSAAAKEHNRNRRRKIKLEKELLKTQQRLKVQDVARMLPRSPDPEGPEAKTIRPLFKKPVGQDAERTESAFAAGVRNLRAALK